MMNTDNQIKNKNFDAACNFIIKLGEAAHGYGSNAGRLEVYLVAPDCGARFPGGLPLDPDGDCFCLPGK